MCRSRCVRLIDRLLLEESLSPRQLTRVRRHVLVCSSCRQRYDRAVLAARLLSGGPDALGTPSQGELDRVGHEVLRARLSPEPPPRRRFVVALGAGSALAVGILIAVVAGGPDADPPLYGSGGSFRARGPSVDSSAGAAAQPRPRVGLRVICVAPNLPPSVTEMPPGNDSVGSCGLDAVLKIAYTNQGPHKWLTVVGVDAAMTLHWYEPIAVGGEPIEIRQAVDEPLDLTLRLLPAHRPGQLRVFGIFSTERLPGSRVEDALATIRRQGIGLANLDSLPLANTVQRSVRLTIVARSAAAARE